VRPNRPKETIVRKLQILGAGCPKCRQLAANAEAAAKALGVECEIEKVTDVNEMMKMGVMFTPALVIDGAVKAVGKVPTVEDIKAMLA
jgi:small redox-active disulfide protein 2